MRSLERDLHQRLFLDVREEWLRRVGVPVRPVDHDGVDINSKVLLHLATCVTKRQLRERVATRA